MRRLEAWTLQYVLVQPLLACVHLATHQSHQEAHGSSHRAHSASHRACTHPYDGSNSNSDGSTCLGSLSDGVWQWLVSSDGQGWVTRVSIVASLVSTTFSLSALVGFYHTFEQVNKRQGSHLLMVYLVLNYTFPFHCFCCPSSWIFQELAKHAPLGKLLCIKAVVGLCFWQAIVLPYVPQGKRWQK